MMATRSQSVIAVSRCPFLIDWLKRPVVSDYPARCDGRLGHNNNNNNNNSMTNRITSVIVSDRGPPVLSLQQQPDYRRVGGDGVLLSASRPVQPRRLDRLVVDRHYSVLLAGGTSERWRLPVLLLLLILSALPNSCSAASIQQASNNPTAISGRRLAQYRHHLQHHTTTTTTTTARPTTTTTSSPSRLVECPWLEWEPTINGQQTDLSDVAGTRAYMAPVVFEGKARSRSDGPVYRVTFDVVTVYKGEVATGSQVRLEFKSGQQLAPSSSIKSTNNNSAGRSRTLSSSRSSSSSNSGSSSSSSSSLRHRQQHHHRHQHHNRECLVTAEIRTGRRYLVFAAHWGPNNFTAFGSPLAHTKKSLKDVRSTLCPRCARSPVAFGLEESVTVKKAQRLILRCRTRGNPVPGVVWFKDGKPLNAGSKRVRIKTKRRRSTLRIRCVKEEDAGMYECRPSNVVGSGTASRTKVTVVKVTGSAAADGSPSSKVTGTSLRPANGSSSLWPLIALPCPIDSFCLNGGTCKYYEAVGELVCQCAEGYKGQRCENKDIYNLGKGGKCRGGRMVGTKCVPTYGAVGGVGGGGGSPGSLLGPTAAAGWAAVPSSQLTWWHWLQAGKIGNQQASAGGNPDDGDDQSCGDDD